MVAVAQLKQREYLRPGECVAVLGRARGFWIGLFDEGEVGGYVSVGGHRYINQSSARRYIESRERKPRRPTNSDECVELAIAEAWVELRGTDPDGLIPDAPAPTQLAHHATEDR